MSRTLVLILIAAFVILFVLSRWLGLSGVKQTDSNPENQVENVNPEYVSWVAFTPDVESFTSKFPRKPEHTSFATNDLPEYQKIYKIYAANGLDKVTYMAQEISFVKDKGRENDEDLLSNTLNEIVSSTNAEIITTQEDKFQDTKALKFETKKGDNKTIGIMFFKNGKVYILSKTSDEKNSRELNDYYYFINSFKIK